MVSVATKPARYLRQRDSFWWCAGFLTKKISEKPPVKGGNEKNWIKQYVDVATNG